MNAKSEGGKLAHIRTQLGLTHRQMASKLEQVTAENLAHMEAGEEAISTDLIRQLVERFRVNVYFLFDWSSEPFMPTTVNDLSGLPELDDLANLVDPEEYTIAENYKARIEGVRKKMQDKTDPAGLYGVLNLLKTMEQMADIASSYRNERDQLHESWTQLKNVVSAMEGLGAR